jgi:hypothetical protein
MKSKINIMGLKITLATGETIEVDYDDYEKVDFTTPEGKAVYQEIIFYKDSVKNWANTDLAEIEDELKFFDNEKEIDISLEEFEEDIYKQILKDEDLL